MDPTKPTSGNRPGNESTGASAVTPIAPGIRHAPRPENAPRPDRAGANDAAAESAAGEPIVVPTAPPVAGRAAPESESRPRRDLASQDIPILVVDDAKFSSAIIAKVLRSGGFTNVRFTNNPMQALRSLEKRPAQILIADWLMPSMDGLELTRRVKKLDESHDHFTYVVLLTARDDFDAMTNAFEEGVDDFLNKANLRAQLLPRVVAAQRIAARQNELLRSNRLLRKKIRELQTTDLVDPVTGLGNQKFTIERLSALLRETESRGGAACLLLVGINNLDVIEQQYDAAVIDELTSGISAKVRALVRPLDIVTHPEQNIFAVMMKQASLDSCTSDSFRRIFDNLYMHSFKTSEGYIPVVVGVNICAADASTGLPDARGFLQFAFEGLKKSFATGVINVDAFDAALASTVSAAPLLDDGQ
jgi:PleD family two-component response regulator